MNSAQRWKKIPKKMVKTTTQNQSSEKYWPGRRSFPVGKRGKRKTQLKIAKNPPLRPK
jgi:GH43 family beta-xylosidase